MSEQHLSKKKARWTRTIVVAGTLLTLGAIVLAYLQFVEFRKHNVPWLYDETFELQPNESTRGELLTTREQTVYEMSVHSNTGTVYFSFVALIKPLDEYTDKEFYGLLKQPEVLPAGTTWTLRKPAKGGRHCWFIANNDNSNASNVTLKIRRDPELGGW